MSLDIDRLIDIATTDPEISNVQSFKDFVRLSDSTSSSERSSFSNLGLGVTAGGWTHLLSLEEGGDIRNVRDVNPGMKEKTSADPDQFMGKYEIQRRDTVPLKTYAKMSKDPVIRLGTNIMIGFISSLKYSLEMPESADSQLLDTIYGKLHSSVVRQLIKYGLRNGFAFAELVYDRRKYSWIDKESGAAQSRDAIGLKKVKWCDPGLSWRYWKSRKDDALKYIEQSQGSKGYVKIPRKKLIWFALDKEYSGVFGSSRYKSAFAHWYYGKIDEQYLMKHLEKCGSPHLETRYPSGKSIVAGESSPVPNDVIAAKIGKHLISNGSVNLPSDRYGDDQNASKGELMWTVEFKEARNNSVQPHLDFLQFSDGRKIQALGMLPSAVLSGGNYSEKDAAGDFLQVMLEDLVDQVETVIRQDVLEKLAVYNFGIEAADLLKFKIDRSGLGKTAMLKELLINAQRLAFQSQTHTPKNMIDFDDMTRELGVKVRPFNELMDEKEVQEESSGATEMKKQQRNEDSNGKDRAGKDTRTRGRPTSNGDATQRTK